MQCFHVRAVTMGTLLGIALSHSAHAEFVTFGSGPDQFNMEFVKIGSPGNAADTTGRRKGRHTIFGESIVSRHAVRG